MLTSDDALIVVDPQVDFFPGGALPVPDGDAILPVVNEAMDRFRNRGLPVFISRDWHPADHCSFQAQGGPWPSHCVRGTSGAELHPGLEPPALFTMVHKATESGREAYSDFDGTGLAEHLRDRGVRRMYLAGLALDYCVKATCLDGIDAGFEMILLIDATRAVNVDPEDGDRAMEQMTVVGVRAMQGTPR
jgi:nicotinamidase/pyrazinamidase